MEAMRKLRDEDGSRIENNYRPVQTINARPVLKLTVAKPSWFNATAPPFLVPLLIMPATAVLLFTVFRYMEAAAR